LQSEVFAVAFAVLAAGAIILTLNVLLLVLTLLSPPQVLAYVCTSVYTHKLPPVLFVAMITLFHMQGGQIIFFQSLSLLGYCLFPLDVGALICLLNDNDILKIVVVAVTLAWSSWAAYPFMSAAVKPRRKALALYPVFLLYVSVGFLIIAIN
jgi:hypothetical protein